LFSLLTQDGREHFILPLVLAEVDRQGGEGQSEGYIPSASVYSYAQKIGYAPSQLEWALERAVGNHLLEARSNADGSDIRYRLTSIGAYIVWRLPSMFAYLDAVVVDTPILDDGYRNKILDAHTIDERLNRAELFRIYLDRQWQLCPPDQHFDWTSMSEALHDDIRTVGKRFAGWP
jgi:hypothetical protein